MAVAAAEGEEPVEIALGDPARYAPIPPAFAPQSDPEAAAMWQLMADEDWYGAEVAARAILERRPREAHVWCALGSSLLRQDRLRDARDAAQRCGDRGLVGLIERKLLAAARFEEHQVAHFHVRYDGEVHEEIARDVLRLLDAGYASLVTTLGFEPRRPIPVQLLSKEAYEEETGKSWSAGQYSHGDGKIRLKVRGLTVTPRFEETVRHELVHAFLGDLTHDRTPREVNEGLAQYVSGRRMGWEITSDSDAARYPWKRFYDDSLSFTEYLIAQRGVSGVVEALGRLGESGDANGSFRQVFGDDLRELQRKWAIRRRQVAGS